MLTQIINGRIFTPQGWLNEGSVLMRDGKILEVTNCDLALIGARLIDAKGMYIVPGFVCMHAHGGGGHDFTECTEEAFRSIINAHLGHGATSFYPTISSSPFEKLHQAAQVCEQLMAEPDSPVLGLHIEGPYLNSRAKTFVLRVDGRTAGSGNYFVHVELLVSDALSPLCDLRVRGRFE